MIALWYVSILSPKKIWLIVGVLVGIGILLTSILWTDVRSDRYLQEASVLYYHTMSFRIIGIGSAMLVTLLVMDHDVSFIRHQVPYVGRFRYFLSKLLTFILIISWMFLMIWMIHQIINLTFLGAASDVFEHVSSFISLWLDAWLIMIMILYWIREKHPSFALFIPLFYLFYSFVIDDYPTRILYYLWPIHGPVFDRYVLALLYKVCYICLGLCLTYHKMAHEDLK